MSMMEEKRDEKLTKYKTAIKDIRYLMNKYKSYTAEVWDTIWRIVNDPKLK